MESPKGLSAWSSVKIEVHHISFVKNQIQYTLVYLLGFEIIADLEILKLIEPTN